MSNTNTILKKLLRGKKACSPAQHLMIKKPNGTMTKGSVKIGQGEYGKVYRGCVNDKCEKYIVYKETTDPSAKMEFTIAKKLEGFGVPKMYLYKNCDGKDILYSEYINGKEFNEWWKTEPTLETTKSVIAQVIYNLYKIHEKYPGFRHHDLHGGNVLVRPVPKKNIQIKLKNKTYTISNGGVEAVMIDFGFSTFPRIKNPLINSGNYRNLGISRNSDKLYDLHYFLNGIHNLVRKPRDRTERRVYNFITSLIPIGYTNRTSYVVKNYRLRGNRGQKHYKNLPDFETVLSKSFFTGEKKTLPVPKTQPQPRVVVAPPKPKTPTDNKNAYARAVAIFKAGKVPPQPKKRPGIVAKKVAPYKFTNVTGKERVYKYKGAYEKALAKNNELKAQP
jgi:predicted Ser/Thr protein kinase